MKRSRHGWKLGIAMQGALCCVLALAGPQVDAGEPVPSGKTAQVASQLEGVWVFGRGPDFPGLRYMRITRKEGNVVGTITTDWYGDVPMNKLRVKGDTARFEIDNGNARLPPREWKATLTDGRVRVTGDIWYQQIDLQAERGTPADAKRLAFAIAPLPQPRKLQPDGQAPTPPMGWSSWNKFAEHIDDRTIRGIADALVSTGLRDAGYVHVNIDDGWQGERDANGVLQPNERFPDMKALADYVHAKGLKLGIYSSPGPKTCAGYTGSYGHVEQDAATWARWGIDYLKYDLCSGEGIFRTPEQVRLAYQQMGEALRATHRPMIYSLCQYGRDQVGAWGREVGGHLWRTTGDIEDKYEVMAGIGFARNGDPANAGPGGWNDPDMLEVGNGGMTPDEYRTHMSLWALSAAPLLLGNDLREMSAGTLELLLNRQVIAIDQDRLGQQGKAVRKDGLAEIWAKPLADGSVGIGLFNRDTVGRGIVFSLADVGWPEGKVSIVDVWSGKPVASGMRSIHVPAHGVVLLKLTRGG